MKYILILLTLGSHANSAHHVTFDDKPACEAAISKLTGASKVQGWQLTRWVTTVCVPQGTEIP